MFKTFATIMMVGASLMSSKFSQREISTEIYAMQNRLAALGYFNIKVTGMYGTLTETAFKQFQYANGFEITGVVTDEQLNHLYSLEAQPKLDSNRNITSDPFLNNDSFSVINQRVTQTFSIKFITINKTATYKVNSSQGHLIGELENLDVSELNPCLRYPIIATIQDVNYPASMDITTGGIANLHFKDSVSYLGIPDSEHQFNINKLLGL